MERTLKDPAIKPHQSQGVFLFPGRLEVEPWEVWITSETGKNQCAQACASPKDNPWQKRSTLVLPIAQVFCLPLWLNETDPDRFPGMIELQLESRGLSARGAVPTVYQWEIVMKDAKRTLVLVGILPAVLSPQLQIRGYRTFDVSARYFSWPENSLTIWQEQGKLAAAFSRGKSLVYFQTLGDDHCSARTLQTLICLRASLEIQRVLDNLSEVTVTADLSPQEIGHLKEALGLPVRQSERPSPVSPSKPWNLCPPEISQLKQEQQTRRWKSRIFLLTGLAYLLIAAILLIQFLFTISKLRDLHKWQADHATVLASVHQAQDDWQYFNPVVDTDNYPLEILLHCASAIPKNQLRMTLFEMENGTVEIKGEANNVSAAYVFFDQLKSDPHLASYTWKMDDPHLLPNDLAQLQIEGTRAKTNP